MEDLGFCVNGFCVSVVFWNVHDYVPNSCEMRDSVLVNVIGEDHDIYGHRMTCVHYILGTGNDTSLAFEQGNDHALEI